MRTEEKFKERDNILLELILEEYYETDQEESRFEYVKRGIQERMDREVRKANEAKRRAEEYAQLLKALEKNPKILEEFE